MILLRNKKWQQIVVLYILFDICCYIYVYNLNINSVVSKAVNWAEVRENDFIYPISPLHSQEHMFRIYPWIEIYL